MGSRFSAFQGKGGAVEAQPVEIPADIARAVQIPRSNRVAPAKQDALTAQDVRMNDRTLDARVRLHRKLIEEINLVALERLPQDEMRKEIKGFVVEVAQSERLALNVSELESLVDDLVDEMVGLGPLEPLLKDPSISDILINGHENCFVERGGKLVPVAIPFKDEAHLLRIVNKIVAGVGRRIDESSPMCDARMKDGSRFNAAIRPVGVDGPLVSIRKFSKNKLGFHRLVEFGALTQIYGGSHRGGGERARHHNHFRRHGHGQDDHAQRIVGLHS